MKISVALCTYNGERYLEKQLDSILNQTVSVNEIVICDDCSKDATISILEKYAVANPNIFKIYQNEQNLRSNKNFEKAISLTSGDFIFLSDQDDIWNPKKVEKTLNVFQENPAAEGVFSNASLIDDNDNFLFENKISLWDTVYFFEEDLPKPIDLYKLLIFKGNYITGATLCIKENIKKYCFPFATLNKIFLHDEWLAYLLANRKTLFYSKECLLSYRLHSQQQTGIGGSLKKKKRKEKLPLIKAILGLEKPTSFNTYKILSRFLLFQLNKYKEIQSKYPQTIDSSIEKELLNSYLDAKEKMRRINPLLYFFYKKKDEFKQKKRK